jgi:alpha-tubulin suppressor-like RCC1 family protein
MRVGRLAVTVIASLTFAASAQATTVRSAAGWGFNGKAEAGAGFASDHVLEPVGVQNLTAIKTVAASGFWGAALLRDGTVMTWGGNNDGQLGDGTTEMKSTPLKVAGLGHVKQIAIAGEHFIALLSDGTVMTWGSNRFGQLGNGTDGGGKEACSSLCDSTRPIPVAGLSGVVAVFAGGASDAALLSDGSVMAWGENKSGQLGDGTAIQKDRPTRAQFTNVKPLRSAARQPWADICSC